MSSGKGGRSNRNLNSSFNSVLSPKNTLLKYFPKSPVVVTKDDQIKDVPPSEKKMKNKNPSDSGEELEVEYLPLKKLDNSEKDSEEEDGDFGSKRKILKRKRFILSTSEEEVSEDEDRSKASSSPKKPKKDNESKELQDAEKRCSPENAKENTFNNKLVSASKKSARAKEEIYFSQRRTFEERLNELQNGTAKTETNPEASKRKTIRLDEVTDRCSNMDEPALWPHQKLDFLKADKIKDKEGRRPDDPDYDETTLYVPKAFLDNQSPGLRQWWIMKSNNYDCVLFFKVGKFYELYHMDADIGVKELGFTYMRGEFAHSGFPEVSFDRMWPTLVERGYKVARVEQTETPDMMNERCRQMHKTTKFDKVVRREICHIITKGTQVFAGQSGALTLNHHRANYMLAIIERKIEQKMNCNDDKSAMLYQYTYGVCFLDTSIGDCYLGEFDDDTNCSRLHTLISHNTPVLLLMEKNNIKFERTLDIIRTVLIDVRKETISNKNDSKFNAEKTLKDLSQYFWCSEVEENSMSGEPSWPTVLRNMQDPNDHLGLTPSSNTKLALKALGLCMEFMKKCEVDLKIIPDLKYHTYKPPDLYNAKYELKTSNRSTLKANHMILDANTLSNLRIIGEENTLQSTVDHCCTKFGKRLLHHWLCVPLCDVYEIRDRQLAISLLKDNGALLQNVRSLFATLPDFERNLAQMTALGSKLVQEKHPDGRAILFEEKVYNKRKILNFIGLIKGFAKLLELPAIFKEISEKSILLKRLSQLKVDGGTFPDMSKQVKFFQEAFNHEKAAESGVIIPVKGTDSEYDEIELKISNINMQLQDYLIEQEKLLGCSLTYFGNDKKRFQLEVPEKYCRRVPSDYVLESQRKGNKPVQRFVTTQTKKFLKEMQNAEMEQNTALKDIARRIFGKLSQQYDLWKQCTNCVAYLDVLMSLAEYAQTHEVSCLPVFKEQTVDAVQSFIKIDNGYHPCLNPGTYIPNGIALGTRGKAPLTILTGPNMGGKSTLMRQVGLLVVLAQIGSYIPANSCRMTVIDRIFTRLGAHDDIITGHSTFLVELNETSLILKHATANSLVLLDELGRGTATYDGTAIAASVVNYLSNLKCCTLFSTHYHNLIDYFHRDERISLAHMACMVENDDSDDPTKETVVFLYTYSDGPCPKSYGFNAAKLAGMPRMIIKRAYELSKGVEANALKHRIASNVMEMVTAKSAINENSLNNIKNLITQFKQCKV